MTPRTEEEKARRKEAHRVSMVASGGLFVFMALAAGYVFFSKAGMPSFLLGKGAQPKPRLSLPYAIKTRVAWRPWGPAVGARARREGRPILLVLSAPWSYWSRLLDARAFADPATAALIAERFVAARADADERPDAARRYGGSVLPTLCVLLPNGQILDSAGYMEPESLRAWLTGLAEGWTLGRARAEAAAAKALEERARAKPLGAPKAAEVADRARRELAAAAPSTPLELEDTDPPLGKRLEARRLAGLATVPALAAAEAAAEARAGGLARARARLTLLGERKGRGLLDDGLALASAELDARRPGRAAAALLAVDGAFLEESSGALFDRAATGELPAPLDRILDPRLNFKVWELYGRTADALPAGDPRRARFRSRARVLEPWLLARAAWLPAAERLILATEAQRGLQP